MQTLHDLDLFKENLYLDIWDFAPEIVLCGTIVAMLLLRLRLSARAHMRSVALGGVLLALVIAATQWWSALSSTATLSRPLFQGLLVYDTLTLYLRMFLLIFAFLIVVLTIVTRLVSGEDSADFYTLLIGAVIGMALMASANHLLMIFLAVEMASVPCYALAGFLKQRRQSSEAALKYVVYGGAAAGVMLYGISLLAGMFGTLHLPTLAQEMAYRFASGSADTFDPALLLALVLVLTGLAFKLSAFPFHFWCPDVFEGAAAEVAAFLSVASKGAGIALVIRFSFTLVGHHDLAGLTSGQWEPVAQAMGQYLSPILAVIAIVTCTFGNLAAYGQTNLKRLLAYSTIAHAGYMLLALVPLTAAGAKAALFYLFVYLLMNLGAFSIVAFVRNRTGSEEMSAFQGLIYRAPCLAVALTIFLLSLVGLPPLAGFVGKFQVFAVLYQTGWITLLVIAALNTVISLVYYVNVVRVMILVDAAEDESRWTAQPACAAYAGLLAVLTLLFGVLWTVPERWSTKGAESLQPVGRVIVQRADIPDTPAGNHYALSIGRNARQ